MHGTVAPNVEQQQLAYDAWRTEFNHVRPYEALAMKTPSEVYEPSPRKPVEGEERTALRRGVLAAVAALEDGQP